MNKQHIDQVNRDIKAFTWNAKIFQVRFKEVALSLTISELMRITGLAMSTAHHLRLSKVATPSIRTLAIICGYTGISLDWILGLSERKYQDDCE